MQKPPRQQPVKFLTNKELLAEIHRCKTSYCSFVDGRFATYDAIVNDLAEVTDEFLALTQKRRSKELTPRKADPVHVPIEGMVIRLMTFDHIPLDSERPKKSRQKNRTHAQVPFPPFKHFVIEIEGGKRIFREVGRSHWEGGIENGWFNASAGRTTERMGRMYEMLVERYGRRANWRGYSYLDEMKSQALFQLCSAGLQFDESKSANPFSFYTTTMTHCFTRIFNNEKRVQEIRDDILISSGAAPSSTYQVAHELAREFAREGVSDLPKIAGKRGRKSAAEIAREKGSNPDIR